MAKLSDKQMPQNKAIEQAIEQAGCAQDKALSLRAPQDVMRLEALGASFPHRLSFKRTLIRKLHEQGAALTVQENALDDEGFGHIVLSMPFCGRTYSLIGYSRALADEDRTDRVIATAWDASFCLFDGVPTSADIAYLADEVTHQEAGIYHEKVMSLSRANKSIRLFAHVVEALSQGRQPSHEMIAKIGYLMRTTAVYGNGKFGIADRDLIKSHEGLEGPFRAEMLTVFLIREFTFQLVDHCARVVGGDAAAVLSPSMRRNLGVGNSTGLGMAPFLIYHPNLFHSWILVRETAIARCRQLAHLDEDKQAKYLALYQRVAAHLAQWQVDDESYQHIIAQLVAHWEKLGDELGAMLAQEMPFEALMGWANDRGADQINNGQIKDNLAALMGSFIMEYVPELTDGLEECMTQAREPALEPKMALSEVARLIDENYQWALALDLDAPESRAQFWYVSEEKLEPRLGNAHIEEGQEREMPFAMAYYIADLQKAMAEFDSNALVAELLLRHPELRYIVRRIQNVAHFTFAEVHGNLVGAACRPIDLLRCKLSFFGASKFDPRSDRWTRITLYQGAPTAADLDDDAADDWAFWVVKDGDNLPQKNA